MSRGRLPDRRRFLRTAAGVAAGVATAPFLNWIATGSSAGAPGTTPPGAWTW